MKAGFATTDITPREPVWLVGYGSRDHKSEGIYAPLEAGAVALSDGKRSIVLLTADIIGYSLGFASEAKARIAEATGLLPGDVILTATHTHCAPYFYEWAMVGEVEMEWAGYFMGRLVEVACKALAGIKSARIEFSRGRSEFGVSRRLPDGEGGILFKPNHDGPMDRDLDTLWFNGEGDEILGSLTVYGCHTTCRGGFEIGPDYPGFFRQALSESSGAPAFFSTGCAGNIRPNFYSDDGGFRQAEVPEIAEAGKQMATDAWASRKDGQHVENVCIELVSDFHSLPYTELPNEQALEAAVESERVFDRLWGKHFLALAQQGRLPETCPQEIQILKIGEDLRMIFLGGEVLTEIGIHLKEAFAPATTVTVAYSNGLIAYVPGKETYDLGGYEVNGSHTYFLRPAPFVKEVEDLIVAKTLAMAGRGPD